MKKVVCLIIISAVFCVSAMRVPNTRGNTEYSLVKNIYIHNPAKGNGAQIAMVTMVSGDFFYIPDTNAGMAMLSFVFNARLTGQLIGGYVDSDNYFLDIYNP